MAHVRAGSFQLGVLNDIEISTCFQKIAIGWRILVGNQQGRPVQVQQFLIGGKVVLFHVLAQALERAQHLGFLADIDDGPIPDHLARFRRRRHFSKRAGLLENFTRLGRLIGLQITRHDARKGGCVIGIADALHQLAVRFHDLAHVQKRLQPELPLPLVQRFQPRVKQR